MLTGQSVYAVAAGGISAGVFESEQPKAIRQPRAVVITGKVRDMTYIPLSGYRNGPVPSWPRDLAATADDAQRSKVAGTGRRHENTPKLNFPALPEGLMWSSDTSLNGGQHD